MKFRVLRRCFMALVFMTSMTCVVFSVALGPYISTNARGTLWVLLAVPTLSAGCCVWSTTRKWWNRKRPQKVAIEITWSFAILPIQLILGLVSYSPAMRFIAKEQILLCNALRVVIWINATLLGVYVNIIMFLALMTQLSYDRDVWYKDIDNSPSPFPLSFISAYIISFIPSFLGFSGGHREEERGPCLPGCTCSRKLHEAEGARSEVGGMWGDRGPGPVDESEEDDDTVRRGSRTLRHWEMVGIRVPTEDERRDEIIVSFEVVEVP